MKASKLVTTTALLGLGLTLAAPSVLAAPGAVDAKNVVGEGTIKYIEDTGKEGTTDPEKPDPDKPVKPGDGNENENEGALRIDFVSNLRFGDKNKVTTKKGEYFAEATTITLDDGTDELRGNYVQVTDKRSSDNRGNGWALSAKMTKQFSNAEGTLNGATLTYDHGFVNTFLNDTKTAVDVKDPATEILALDNSVEFIKADKDTGWGTYTLEFGRPITGENKLTEDTSAKGVKLTVPANTPLSTKNVYQSEILWTIEEVK